MRPSGMSKIAFLLTCHSDALIIYLVSETIVQEFTQTEMGDSISIASFNKWGH